MLTKMQYLLFASISIVKMLQQNRLNMFVRWIENVKMINAFGHKCVYILRYFIPINTMSKSCTFKWHTHTHSQCLLIRHLIRNDKNFCFVFFLVCFCFSFISIVFLPFVSFTNKTFFGRREREWNYIKIQWNTNINNMSRCQFSNLTANKPNEYLNIYSIQMTHS